VFSVRDHDRDRDQKNSVEREAPVAMAAWAVFAQTRCMEAGSRLR
jgi:hypothetical protein